MPFLIHFFFLLENGFEVLYDELKDLQHELGLHFTIPKKPKPPEYREKLRRVRNTSAVHWGGPDKKQSLDSQAGRKWGFSLDATADTFIDLCFGSISLAGANDRQLLSLPETHRICVDYLKQFDMRCAEIMERIVSHLPRTRGSREYVSCEPGGLGGHAISNQ